MAKPWYLRKRFQKKAVGLLVGLLIVAVGYYSEGRTLQNQTPPPPGTYRVIRVDDGDTIVVDMAGTDEKIRFIGVDTPETQDPRKAVQCFGKAATAYTRQRIGTDTVRLMSDPLSSNRDRYNRLLCYVYLSDGALLNQTIIADGYGFAYLSFPFTKSDYFAQSQTQAREQSKGLWSSCNPEQNKYGGYTSQDE